MIPAMEIISKNLIFLRNHFKLWIQLFKIFIEKDSGSKDRIGLPRYFEWHRVFEYYSVNFSMIPWDSSANLWHSRSMREIQVVALFIFHALIISDSLPSG